MALQNKYVLMNDSGYNSEAIALNSEQFCYSFLFVKKTYDSVNKLKSSFSSLENYRSLISESGNDLTTLNKANNNGYSLIQDLFNRMTNTKTVLESKNPSMVSLFNQLEAQYNIMDLFQFGDLESETDQQLFWENIKQLYDGAKDKDPETLNDLEKYAVQLYVESGYADRDKYFEMQTEIENLEKEFAEVRNKYYAMCMQANPNNPFGENFDDNLAKQYTDLYAKITELRLKEKDLSASLKERGLLEYTAWEQLKNGFGDLTALSVQMEAAFNKGDYDAYTQLSKEYSDKLRATTGMITGKFVAGIAKVGEWLVDGFYLFSTSAGTAELLVQGESQETIDKMWDDAYTFIARDLVGEGEDWFYNDTETGKKINENSVFKYNSAGAEIFKNIATKLTEMGIAVTTGGAGAVILGFAEGTGQAAEHQFNIVDPDTGAYTRRNFTGVALSFLGGVGKAAEFYGYHHALTGLKEGVKTVHALGTKGLKKAFATISSDTAKNYLNQNFKSVASRAFTTMLHDTDTWIDTGTAVVHFITSGIESEKEFKDWKWGTLALDIGTSVVGNYIGAFGQTYIGDLQAYKHMDPKYVEKFQAYEDKVIAARERLRECHEKFPGLYEQGNETGAKYAIFTTYEEHHNVHVTTVADESLATNKCIVQLIDEGQANGLGKLDDKILNYAGLGHDTGMREGGYALMYFEEYDNKGKLIKGFRDIALVQDDITSGSKIRSAHSSVSATTILFEKIGGEDCEFIAALDFLHSKSNSGVKNVTSDDELEAMIYALYKNSENKDYSYKFDITKFGTLDAKTNVFTIDPEVAAQLKTGAIALRVGDARALKTGFTQGGNLIDVEDWCSFDDLSNYMNGLDPNKEISLKDLIDFENQNSVVNLVDIDGNVSNATSEWITGERNWKSLGETVEDGMLTYHDMVVSGNNPASTIDKGITEKFGEYYSFLDAMEQKVVIHFPELPDGSFDKDLMDFYKDFLPKSNNWGRLGIGTDAITMDYDNGLISFVFGGNKQ